MRGKKFARARTRNSSLSLPPPISRAATSLGEVKNRLRAEFRFIFSAASLVPSSQWKSRALGALLVCVLQNAGARARAAIGMAASCERSINYARRELGCQLLLLIAAARAHGARGAAAVARNTRALAAAINLPLAGATATAAVFTTRANIAGNRALMAARASEMAAAVALTHVC